MKLTLFYDARCPLCSAEIDQLKRYDTQRQLMFEDINDKDFCGRFPHIDRRKADEILHGQLSTGEMLYGLDVTCLAWRTVGRHRWLAVLRWPVIRWPADLFYRVFARNRHKISSFYARLVKVQACNSCKLPVDRDN